MVFDRTRDLLLIINKLWQIFYHSNANTLAIDSLEERLIRIKNERKYILLGLYKD